MIDIFDNSGVKIESSEVLKNLLITKSCQHIEELMKSNYIQLSWSDAKKYQLPVGAYIVPFPDEYNHYAGSDTRYPIKYRLFEPYTPEASNEASYKYEPQFQHPIMWLDQLPLMLITGEVSEWDEAVKKTTWGYTGSPYQIASKIVDCINWLAAHYVAFGDIIGGGWIALVDTDLIPSITVNFDSTSIMSGASQIASACDCEYHFDFDRKQLRLGTIRYGTEITLTTGINVGVASVSRTKKDYHNSFLVKGSTKNLSQTTDGGENVQVTERLTLDPTIYPDSTMYTDEAGNIITRTQFMELGIPSLMEELVFDDIYPKLELYIYNVRERKCWLLDEDGNKVEDSEGVVDPDDGKKYKAYSKWYVRLAYPIYTTDAEGNRKVARWTDYTLSDDNIIEGQTAQITFLANTEEGALNSLMLGQGDFDVVYFDKETHEKEDDDMNADGFTAKPGDYRIVFTETGSTIIPTTSSGGIYPQGDTTPQLTNNKATLINVVVDDAYKEQARLDLEMVAKRKVALLRSDLNNYELPSDPVYFEKNNPQIHLGQAVVYNDGQTLGGATPYTLETHIIKIVTQLDYPFVRDITVGNEKVKGDVTTLKEQVSTIMTGTGGSGDGMTEEQVGALINSFGSKYFLSKTRNDTAQGIITLLKGLKIGDGGNNQITAEGLAQLYAFMTYNFQAGFYGTGAQIDHTGNAELDSLFVRKFISTPKFVFNEVAVTKAEQWNTNGFGTIESVDLETQQITLKLEENDYGSLAVGDICRGIFADIGNVYGSDKITDGAQDDCNFVQHKGFFTAYFYVKRIITSEQGKFVFEYGKKSESTPDPCAYMDFAQYGSFTDEQRRSSMYFCSRGRSYIEVLDGVDTWVIAPEHRVARYGWLGGLRIKKEDGTYRSLDGNGLFAQNNVYFGGTVEFLQGLSGLDDLIKQRESYDVSLSQYQSVLTVDDMGNVINGLYTEDEAETMKQYRVSTAVFVRRGQEILLEEDDDVEDVTEGHYRLYVVSDDCDVKIQNSTIFVTGIKNVKDGVAGTDDDADFDYDAMRQMTDAMVTIVVDLEGKTSKTVQMPIRIQHDSLPFMVCDLSNEHAGVAWNTKTGRYVGFPIETQVNLYYQNTPHEISDLTVSCPTGMTATVEKTGGKITGKITITGDNLTEDTLEQVSEVRITAVGVYAGARYEYTKTLTVTKSADTVVYEVVPSVDSIVVDKNGGKSADTLTCTVYATSSDDKRYQLDALPTGFVLKYGLGDTATTAMALGDTVTVGDTKQVTFALFDASGNILDREGVPVLAYGKDGKGIEYIYKRTKDNTKPTNPTPSDWETNADYQSQETEYIPTGWTDDPTGVDAVNMYEWVCVRTSTNGKWGTFSDPAEYAHFGKHAPSARCSDDIVTIPTDSDGNALEAFSETLTFDLLVDGRACTLTGVDKYSSTLSNVTCSISSYKATISCSNNAGLGRVAQTIVFAVTGTLDGASYTDYVTVKVLPNVTGADGDGYEYVYYLSSSATAPSAPSRTGGTLTSGWVDDPPALTDTKRYIYMAYKMGVIGGDGTFGTPRLWAYKAKDGADGVGTVTAYQRSELALTSTPTITDYATFKTRGDLGNGWTKSVPAISDVSANNNTSGGDWSTATDGGYSWYKSPTVSASGIATMQIYFTTAAAGQYVTFYLKAYSEASYDYVLISELDSTSLTRTSGYSARTSGNGVETSVKLKCATAGQHYVTVAYAKDDSGDKNGDYGLVRIDTSGLLYCCDGAVVDGAIAWGTPYQVEGEKGDQGETGNGVASVTVCYAISASNTEAPTSGWSTAMVNPTSAKPYLWSKTVTTYTNGSSDESTPVVIGNFAEQGPKGTNGCIVRQSDWTSGVEYHNDSALTTDGVKYIDVVYVENSSSNYGYDQYQCAKSHTSSSSLTYTNTEYWTKLSDVNPIYTPLIIAKNAVLKFAQTNQLLVMKSDGSTVNVGLGGGDYPLWIGAATATAAAFKVDASGKLYATEAKISGNIIAESGKIGGFTISENGLTHIVDGSMGTTENLGYIICRNDYYGRFAGIGASILPATSGGVSAVARFSNTDTKSLFSTNIALMLSAENGDMGNFAFYGKGNGVLDGWTGGFKLTKITPPTASGIDSGLLSFKENNTFIIYNIRNGAGVALPRLNIIAEELGLSTLSIPNFCVHITVCSDISSLSSNNWKLYGRCNVKSSSGTYPWNDSTNPYPVLVDENASQVDSIEMGPGDTVELLLIYDSSQYKTYTIGSTSVTAKYTARLIHRRS